MPPLGTDVQTGGALYGTRIRFLSISDPIIFFWKKMFIFLEKRMHRQPARQPANPTLLALITPSLAP